MTHTQIVYAYIVLGLMAGILVLAYLNERKDR